MGVRDERSIAWALPGDGGAVRDWRSRLSGEAPWPRVLNAG